MASGLPARAAVHAATIRFGLPMSVTAILVMTLLPRPWLVHGGTSLVPFSSIWEIATSSVASSVAARNLGANVFAVSALRVLLRRRAPFAAFGALGNGGSGLLGDLGGALSGRPPTWAGRDVDDVLLNVCGAVIGAIGYAAATSAVGRTRRASRR
jgi:hypothetical protein